MQDPFVGIGKPEPLKYMDADIWSWRIDARTSACVSSGKPSDWFSRLSISLRIIHLPIFSDVLSCAIARCSRLRCFCVRFRRLNIAPITRAKNYRHCQKTNRLTKTKAQNVSVSVVMKMICWWLRILIDPTLNPILIDIFKSFLGIIKLNSLPYQFEKYLPRIYPTYGTKVVSVPLWAKGRLEGGWCGI